jgi:thymidylate synthase
MRIFANTMEMYNEVRRDIHELGVLVHPQTMQDKDVQNNADYQTLELSPYGFTIVDGSDAKGLLDGLNLSSTWMEAEFAERISSDAHNPGHAWEIRKEVWKQFMHHGRFAYTYSERMNRFVDGDGETTSESNGALAKIFHELHDRPDTRQAVLPIFNGDSDLPNLGGKARVPCSLHYQFMRRNDALQMIYVMRSSDFLTHFPFDIALAVRLQKYMAKLLVMPVGHFTFFTGSLHMYKKDSDPGVF